MEHRGRPCVHPEGRAEWRDWLAEHHATSDGVWLVSWKAATGRPRLPYEEAVEEALCVGWIDSLANTLDDERSLQLMTPRKRGSGWSRRNKERVQRLTAAGLMRPAGLAAVEAARADGSWSLFDAVEDLIEPDELRAGLEERPGARERWDRFSPSSRKAALQWIATAKRPETRARRIAETVRLAAEGRRPIG
ncbi:MAG TPA: YdeI/OmpD-associated family protein [Miltoncostaeaceae bacterium]|nr:YdeI/OmpD-associated family protein [Miltoncostaeaceae bacterium]